LKPEDLIDEEYEDEMKAKFNKAAKEYEETMWEESDEEEEDLIPTGTKLFNEFTKFKQYKAMKEFKEEYKSLPFLIKIKISGLHKFDPENKSGLRNRLKGFLERKKVNIK